MAHSNNVYDHVCFDNKLFWKINKMDKFTKRGTDGSVDVVASAEAYALALTTWCATNEIPAEEIATAVNAVLDRNPGRIAMPALQSLATQELGATPSTFKVLADRVHSYVTGQAKAGLLFVIKGKNGGVSRTAPVKKSA
jgi:hypothetical protein